MIQKGTSAIVHALCKQSMMKMGDTVTIAVSPVSYQWLLEKEMIATLSQYGFTPKLSSPSISSPLFFSLHPTSVSVAYSEPFRRSIMSGREIARHISLQYSAQIANKRTGEIYFSGEENWSSTDTIAYDDMHSLENADMPISIGKFTEEHWYENYFEPFVVIGATAVVIFLFFTFRS